MIRAEGFELQKLSKNSKDSLSELACIDLIHSPLYMNIWLDVNNQSLDNLIAISRHSLQK